MTELLDASMAFPSVALTILVGITFLYWTFVILGALDIDILQADADVGDAGDAGDGDADGDGDGDNSSAAEASTFLKPLGLKRVPVTISLTFVFVFSWAICLLTMHYLAPWVPEGILRWVFGLGVLVGSLIFSLPLTAIAITPIAPAFVVSLVKRRRDNVGETCTVSTGRVDSKFGQAKITCNGAELVIPVRCDGETVFERNDKALVIDYDDKRNAYLIEPLPEALKKQLKEK
jgi:hypothetical protein